ncbi:patatin-like phospholipase family protein [Nocardia sp. CWNU-33]|uniref:patatin-like phospholipase family protein n=1 Tax=Nocardia sp. CWNU-33 TaxID=3392117 RepID=UPI00398E7FA2
MAHTEQAGTPRTAVVLGAGGVVGTAWMAGLLTGLRRHGVDLASADLIVGTSAGAIAGAILATGEPMQRLATLPARTQQRSAPIDTAHPRLGEVFAILREPGQQPATARRRVGELALTIGTGDPTEQIERMRRLIGVSEWPDRDLRITVVDAETGESTVWDRHSGVPLPTAVAASTAFPGAQPPIPVDGRYYIDGGLRSATNADLASGAETLVVIEPLAHLFSDDPSPEPLAETVVRIGPDTTALEAFGANLYDRANWAPAYQAGLRQTENSSTRAQFARFRTDS